MRELTQKNADHQNWMGNVLDFLQKEDGVHYLPEVLKNLNAPIGQTEGVTPHGKVSTE